MSCQSSYNSVEFLKWKSEYLKKNLDDGWFVNQFLNIGKDLDSRFPIFANIMVKEMYVEQEIQTLVISDDAFLQ